MFARSLLVALGAMAGFTTMPPVFGQMRNRSGNKPNGRAPGAHKAAWRKAMKARRRK